jgi:hypothetical protein
VVMRSIEMLITKSIRRYLSDGLGYNIYLISSNTIICDGRLGSSNVDFRQVGNL